MAQHRLKNLDTDNLKADCAVCGPQVAVRVGKSATRCDAKVRELIALNESKRATRDRALRYAGRAVMAEILLLMKCQRCGFEAEDMCQLDVDHVVRRVDGGGDTADNLCVLCSNCHRVKTRFERLSGWDVAAFMRLETFGRGE